MIKIPASPILVLCGIELPFTYDAQFLGYRKTAENQAAWDHPEVLAQVQSICKERFLIWKING